MAPSNSPYSVLFLILSGGCPGSCSWLLREKYETENLELVTLKKEYKLSTRRYKGQVDDLTAMLDGSGEQSTNGDDIIAENIRLKDDYIFLEEKLQITQTKLTWLREHYRNTSQTPIENFKPQKLESDKQRESRVEALIVYVKNMGDQTARFAIQNGVKNIGRITGDELTRLAERVSASKERQYLLVNVARFVEYPLTDSQLTSILKGMRDRDSLYAAIALQNAEKKFLDEVQSQNQ